jgi:hypothetical protein
MRSLSLKLRENLPDLHKKIIGSMPQYIKNILALER